MIEDGAFVSVMVSMVNDDTPTEPLGEQSRLAGPIVGAGAVVGAGACLLPGVVIGANATVAAGAVVTRDVAPDVTVLGVPARRQSRS